MFQTTDQKNMKTCNYPGNVQENPFQDASTGATPFSVGLWDFRPGPLPWTGDLHHPDRDISENLGMTRPVDDYP